jgi:TIR domain
MAGAAGRGEKLNVFISYSRDDIAFADQLRAALLAYDFAVTIDRESIRPGEDWEQRLGLLIRDADTIVFVLSPASAGRRSAPGRPRRRQALASESFPSCAAPSTTRFRRRNLPLCSTPTSTRSRNFRGPDSEPG